MNAYELADKLETDKWDEATIVLSIDAGIKMLRQQADRIVELEETINACYAVQKMQAEEVYKGNHRIEELQKDLKYFTDPCNPACRPSVCDCYQARFAINNRKASEK